MIQALQLILALSLLVLIHELGHFMFARLFHVRVEKFYMFFNPRISLFRAKKINGKWQLRFFAPNVEPSMVEVKDALTGETKTDEKGRPVYRPMTEEELAALPEEDWRRYPDNTEWGLGWLPFGGYCSIAGMVDETKASTDLPSEPQSWEFRSKPAWQRLLIIIGGILMNFVGAIVIFAMLLWGYGQDTLPLKNVHTGFYYSEILQQEGFEQQDKILTINGVEPIDLSEIVQKIVIEGQQEVKVLRGTDTILLHMSDDLGTRFLAKQNEFDRNEREKHRADKSYQKQSYVLISEFIPFVIDSLIPNHSAALAGMHKGDSVVAVNGVSTPCYFQVTQELQKYSCDSITVDYYRQGQLYTAHLFIGDQGKMGVLSKTKYDYFELEHTDYSFLQSIPAGIQYGWDILVMYVKQFRLVFTKEGAQSLGGFGAIGGMFPDIWSGYAFWHMTAFLSVILAFMNFLPIPALDGGYILFLLVEIITRRKPSDKFLEKANTIGFYLLLALLILANGNDILKIFF